MIDEQQWQQQEAQRLANERAQEQLETQRRHLLETERLEREQLEEDERLEREERAQSRREARVDGRDVQAGDGEDKPSRGIFGFLRRRPVADEQPALDVAPASLAGVATAQADAAPAVPPMAMPDDMPGIRGDFRESPLQGDEIDGSRQLRRLLAMVVSAMIVVMGGVWFYTANKTPDRLPSGLEGGGQEAVHPSAPGLGIPDPVTRAPVAEALPKAPDLAIPASQDSETAPAVLASDAVAVPALGSVEVIQPSVDALAGTDPVPPAPAIPRSADSAPAMPLEQRLDRLEAAVEEIRQLLLQRTSGAVVPAGAAGSAGAQAPRKAARPVRRTPVAAAPEAAAPAPQYNGRLLSVDMWDGKPSVVVSTGDPYDKRTRVMQPGDSFNGITLREASVQGRSASFDVGGGRLVRLGVEE